MPLTSGLIDRLVAQPVAEFLDHPCRLGHMGAGGHIEIDQELNAVAGREKLLNDKLKGESGQRHEPRDDPEHHDPKSKRAFKEATVKAVKTPVIRINLRFTAWLHLHEPEAHERRHVHGEEPRREQDDHQNLAERQGVFAGATLGEGDW